ncbi:MAG: hypothetical protein U0169_10885 [Polyangiaceae bacterium]
MSHRIVCVILLATLGGCTGLVEKDPGGSDGQLVGSPGGTTGPGENAREAATPPETMAAPPRTVAATPRTTGFELGTFKASYYDRDRLVATEVVSRPAVNYAWSEFRGVASENFRAVWEGTLTATTADVGVDMNTDSSWSDVTILVDGRKVKHDGRSHETFALGPHTIRVEFANHWHTTGFNMSFTSNPVLTVDEARRDVAALLEPDTRVAHVDIYEPSSFTNDVTVTVKPGSGPVFLVLSSYSAANWIVLNPGNVAIKGIAYGAYAPGPTVAIGADVKTFQLEDLRYESADVRALTGRPADETRSAYASEQVTISGR